MKSLFLSIVSFISLFAASLEPINMYTEHYPPYNMETKSGKLSGLSIELLAAMLERMDSKQTIDDVRLMNWKRSYETAKKNKNSMVFSTTRTKSREKFFKWVGPIAEANVGLIALKSKKIDIKDISELKKYKIGAVLGDVGETVLLENGIDKSNIDNVPGEKAIKLSFKKMQGDRIDMFSYNIDVAFANAKQEGYDTDKYEIVYVLKKGQQYFAFNKDTDDEVIKKWQKALDSLKKDGTYKKIYNKYLK